MEDKRELPAEVTVAAERRAYSEPRLVIYGDLTTLTQGIGDGDIIALCSSWHR